jgi:hypothetical protein
MPDDDVRIHISYGCPIDGRTDEHFHTQADWRAAVDAADPFGDQP